jgi:cyclic dehypoxanthinyl futalosine synthase
MLDTLLAKIRGVQNLTTADEYIRMIALSRIMLPNVKNIQASWLTVGKQKLPKSVSMPVPTILALS